MADNWTPKTAKPIEDEWQPTTARVPVAAHTRAPRYNPARLAVESGAQALGMPMPMTDFAIDQLPAIGGTLGLFGGPTGATLGAGAGAIARQALSNEPPKPMTAGLVSGMLPAAEEPGSTTSRLLDVAEQMGVSRVADLLGPGMKLAGKGMSRIAMNLTPESARVAIEEGINASKAGLSKLLTRMGRIGEETRAVVRAAPKTAVFQPLDAIDAINAKLVPEYSAQAIPEPSLSKIQSLNEAFRKKGPMNAAQLHAMKQAESRLAAPVYVRGEGGQLISIKDPVEQRWHQEAAEWANEQLAGRRMPDGTRVGSNLPPDLARRYADLNARESKLIRLKDEAWPVVAKGERGGLASRIAGRTSGYQVGAMTLGGVEGARHGHSWQQRTTFGVGGSLAGAMLMSPQVLSNLALMLSNPALAQAMGFGVRAGGAAATAPNP